MLYVDGVEYKICTPSSEEELEMFVEDHSKKIFGDESLYFPVKTKLKSLGGIGSIPDGYAINLSKPYKWFIIEVELSTHHIFNHIVPQLNKFVQGLRDPSSRKNITEALYNEIKNDAMAEAYVKEKIGSGEIYRFVSSTIDKNPTLVVIIDHRTKELKEACKSIPITEKLISEFKIFERVDARIKNAFLIEPIVEKVLPPPPPIKITSQSEYAIPILESLIELGGSGKKRDVLNKVHEKMKNRLTPDDLKPVPSGSDIRWENHVAWMRFELKRNGYLKADSTRGIWEISDKGRTYYQKIKQ